MCVASFTDAWIETSSSYVWTSSIQSHLLQMRGLKLYQPAKICRIIKSHLLQMRGLKPQKEKKRKVEVVASFTDAWIETEINDINEHVNLVASFTDAWIETL